MISTIEQKRPPRFGPIRSVRTTATTGGNLRRLMYGWSLLFVLMIIISNMTVLCLHETTVSSASEDQSSSSSSTTDTNTHHHHHHHYEDDDNNNSSYDDESSNISDREAHQHEHEHQHEQSQYQYQDGENQTDPSLISSSQQQQQQQQQHLPPQKTKPQPEEGRLWGASAHEESSSNKIPFVAKPVTTTTHQQQYHHHHHPSSTTTFHDPFSTGFHITSRVYTDIHDKKAHFDDTFRDTVVLPYWECGVTGSTTVPIPLQHVQVRHLLSGAKPSSFSIGGGEDNFGPHPIVVVALTPMEIILNSGQQQSFAPGDVILLENVMAGGHKLQGVETSQTMMCMLLTLPTPYHHIGKDKNSLQTIFEKTFWKQNPCKTGLMVTTTNTNNDDKNCMETGRTSHGNNNNWFYGDDADNNNNDSIRSNVLSRWAGPPRAIRRVGLGVIGVGLSLALADFLGKCAPFILAVAFGGGALVLGGTYSVVKLGEYGMDEIEVWSERRLLRLQSGSNTDDNDNNNNNNNGRKELKKDDDDDVNNDASSIHSQEEGNKRIVVDSNNLSPEMDTRDDII
jgi:hypothetical protein